MKFSKMSALVLALMAMSACAHTVNAQASKGDVDSTWTGLLSFYPTGNALLNACSNLTEESEPTMACMSYIHGAIDAQEFTAPKGKTLCVPPNVTNRQLVMVINKYANENPEMLNHSAYITVERAIYKAWGYCD